MRKIFYLLIFSFFAIIGSYEKVAAQYITTDSVLYYCNDPFDSFYVQVTGYVSGQAIETHYGDGTCDTNSLISSPPGMGFVPFTHTYDAYGVYTVKLVLISVGARVDSVTLVVNYTPCQEIWARLYNDVDTNCMLDSGDGGFYGTATIEIDSAGVAVDTVLTSGTFAYRAYGPLGTVYALKVINSPIGFTPSCPSSGITYDTISSTIVYSKNIAFNCISASCVDNAIYGDFSPGVAGACTSNWITSTSCIITTATVTVTFSPKYTYASSFGATSVSVSGNTLTYTVDVSEVQPAFFYALFNPVGSLTLGDTIHTSWVMNPLLGDCDTTNNFINSIDTIRSSYDPNYKSVMPTGEITSGTTLQYTLLFENTGNDTAKNIHIMDTLSDYLDISTIQEIKSSAPMNKILYNYAGHNIVKFDYPNINLLDSSHHGQCDGVVVFSIRTLGGLASGTKIYNRAGIYFDDNTVVMTNTVENIIGTPSGVVTVNNTSKVSVYPNPANDAVTINVSNAIYSTATFTNVLGQEVITAGLNMTQTQVDVSKLPAGMYYITLRGDSGVKVVKFEKL